MTTWPKEILDSMVAAMECAVADDAHAVLQEPAPQSQERVSRRRLAQIAEQLLSTAVQNGLVPRLTPRFRELAGGNTASLVSIASTNIEFVYKADTSNPKLVREARTIEDLRNDPRLIDFGARLPRVYALYEDGPPYAYLMEYFSRDVYPSMKQLFFDRHLFKEPTPEQAASMVGYAVSALADAYTKTRDDRIEPRMMGEAYYARVATNLASAAKNDAVFAPVPITINGATLPPWLQLLDRIQTGNPDIQQLAPPFVTVVHGDPNPGNILIKHEGGQISDVKFIDLKDWKYGDYIFDIAKILHFLLHTGPIEELHAFTNLKVTADTNAVTITYDRTNMPYIETAAEHIRTIIAPVAAELGDPRWDVRLTFAMASNLLGLLPGRLADGLRDEAAILYAEGLRYLNRFVMAHSLRAAGSK
jgi:aminoglycoside phosphotransferase (APT) family kinase protein